MGAAEAGVLLKSEGPVEAAGVGAVPKRFVFGASTLVAGAADGVC